MSTYRPISAAIAVRDFLNALPTPAVTYLAKAALTPLLDQKELDEMQVRVTTRKRAMTTISRRDQNDVMVVDIEITQHLPESVDTTVDFGLWTTDDLAWIHARFAVVDQMMDALTDGLNISGGFMIVDSQNDPIYDEEKMRGNRLFASIIPVTVRTIVLR